MAVGLPDVAGADTDRRGRPYPLPQAQGLAVTAGCAAQSTLAPESFTTFAHLTKSCLMMVAKSSGVPPAASAPCALRRPLSSAAANALLRSAFTRTTAVRGVPLGTM